MSVFVRVPSLFAFGINKPERATFQQYSVQPAENVGKVRFPLPWTRGVI